MSISDLPSERLLFLRSADDTGLEQGLGLLLPKAQVEARPFATAAWLRTLREGRLDGLIVDSNALGLAELHLIEAGLESLDEARPWLLLLVGDRGLVGCEGLLQAPRTALLPRPWTPKALEASLQRLLPASQDSASEFSEPFLDGLVEGLRDPLTSISGYLQLLLQQEAEGIATLVDPAIQATELIGEQLDALHLVASARQSHVGPVDLLSVLQEFVDQAKARGQRLDLEVDHSELGESPPTTILDLDLRPLRASLRVGLLLLNRFGPGGALRLRLKHLRSGLQLKLSSEIAQDHGNREVAPPPYLEELFLRLVRLVPATPWVDKETGAMPHTVGWRWA